MEFSGAGQLLEKQAIKESVVLLVPGAEAQHLGEQLQWILCGQRQQVEELFQTLNVRQLV